MIYFTSDTHFGHDKEFMYLPRNFGSIEAHDLGVIQRWNEIVKSEDEVYHLGDIMLGDNEHGLKCLKQLNGKIHIIRGNHDTDSRLELYKAVDNIVEICEAKTLKINKQLYFLTHYPCITANYDDKPYHSHLINLHGHTHFKDKFYNYNPFMYNVALDAHDCYPISIEQINEDIHNKINELYQEKIKGGEK